MLCSYSTVAPVGPHSSVVTVTFDTYLIAAQPQKHFLFPGRVKEI